MHHVATDVDDYNKKVKSYILKYLAMLLLCLCRCTEQVQNHLDVATKKNNQAVQKIMNSYGNQDSLQRAIRLLDKVSCLDSCYEQAYANKITYLKLLFKFQESENTGGQSKQFCTFH